MLIPTVDFFNTGSFPDTIMIEGFMLRVASYHPKTPMDLVPSVGRGPPPIAIPSPLGVTTFKNVTDELSVDTKLKA